MKMTFDLRLCLFFCVQLFSYVKGSFPTEILCANPTCQEPISEAQGSVTYASSARNVLSFKPGQEIKIISKSKNKDDYWGAVINGRVGYVPSHLIKETRIFRPFSTLIPVTVESLTQNSMTGVKGQNTVPEEAKAEKGNPNPIYNSNLPPILLNTPDSINTIFSESVTNQAGPPSNLNSPNPVSSESYKVVEGTTVYSNEPVITPSPTGDVKVNQQTTVLAENQQQHQKSEQDRATIPPDVINLMGDYQGQLLMSKINLTLENAEDADVSDGEGDDESDDDEDEDEDEEEEEVEEENISESIAKDISKENIVTNEEVKVTVSESSGKQPESADPNAFQGKAQSFQPQPIMSEIVQTETVPEKIVTEEKEAVPNIHGGPFPNTFNPTMNMEVEKAQVQTIANNPGMLHSSPGPNIVNDFTTPLPSVVPTENAQLNQNQQFTTPQPLPVDSSFHLNSVAADSSVKQTEGIEEKSRHNEFLESTPPSTGGSGIPQPPSTVGAEIPKPPSAVGVEIPAAPSIFDADLSKPPFAGGVDEILAAPSTFDAGIPKPSLGGGVEIPPAPSSVDADIPKPSLPGGAEIPIPELPTSQPPVLSNENTPLPEIKVESNENIQKKIQDSIQDQIEITTEASNMNFVQVNDILIERTTEEAIKEEVIPPTLSADAIEDPNPIPSVDSLTTPEPMTETEETPGIFSQVSETISGWFGSSADKPAETELVPETNALPDLVPREEFKIPDVKPAVSLKSETPSSIAPDAYEKPISNPEDLIAEEESKPWTSWLYSSLGADGSTTSSHTFMYLVVTAITVLTFTLGHSFIEKSGKTGPLIAKINKLEQELLVTSKECILLKDEVQGAKEKIVLYENSANDELVLSLQAELEESKKARSELESSIEVLQQELDAATEAGLDLNKMLSEVLTQKGGSESLLKSVESLQAQLNSQQQVIDEMTKKLGVKNEENEALQVALDAANERSESLEDQLKDTNHNFNLLIKEKEDLAHDLKSQVSQLQVRINQMMESKGKEIKVAEKKIEELQKKLSETTKSLGVKEEEFKALKDSIKQLKTKGNPNLESVFDVSRVKGELAQVEKEHKVLQAKLKEEENSKKVLEETNKSFSVSIENMKKQLEEAEQKKDEAEKKLEVLSTYFKEKETQLQKELGMQEALWAQKKGDEKAVYNMMKSLQEEVDSYKSQNETLKKEILDQERGLKNQIATLEQKAHENWVAARQAERKLEETKQETAQLRNRLTLIEKNSNNVEGKANHRVAEELNGEPPTSPVLHDTSSPLLFPPMPLDPSSSSMLPPGFMPHPMFMPPPMGGFIPPPPFLPGDRRPPPLGRMSSPPLNSRFSPSSPADYPFERMPSPPLSPPVRNYRSPNEADRDHYRHRTPPYPPMLPRNWEDGSELPGFIPISSQRDSIREHKGSNVSSGHSSSDSLDKSSRHSGRV